MSASVGVAYDIVIPTIGRPSLQPLLSSLAEAAARGCGPRRVLVVDDRPLPRRPLARAVPPALDGTVEIVRGSANGPAGARNAGWRRSSAPWVAFLDDDVELPPDWCRLLDGDLAGLGDRVAGSQGRITVPLPAERRPTDWERNVAGLERARWATADMAFRRAALAVVGGFDERFPRAYREDADLALRLLDAGWELVRGERTVRHPVGSAGWWTSVRLQRGNADDALMGAVHGRGWRERASVPRGRRRRHLATTAAAAVVAVSALRGRPGLTFAGATAWCAGTAELAWARIAPGPRDAVEVARMLSTSAVLPFAATAWWVRGWPRALVALVRRRGEQRRRAGAAPPQAVLLDRDGTLVVDVPYNGDPDAVEPMPGAKEALDRLRLAGVPVAVVSNQSGIGRGLLTREQVDAVNARVEELLGPVGHWAICPHAPDDGCPCRKPADGLVREAAAALGVDPGRCAVLGDIGADVDAARAAGARSVLVPTARTRPEEVAAAPEVAIDLPSAVELLLGGAR